MKKITFLTAAIMCGALMVTAQNIENGHEYVDLGLPSGTKWATCNVGANAPEEFGNYYAWGETTAPKDDYYWDTYKWCAGSQTTLTKYCNDANYGNNGFTDGKNTLDPEDDAAAVNWGGTWRMPTHDDWVELRDNCTWTLVKGYNGTDKNGYEVKSKTNGNSIFLPATGGANGNYWQNAQPAYQPYSALFTILVTTKTLINVDQIKLRYAGLSVRPVCEHSTDTSLAEKEVSAIYVADGRIVCEQDFRVYDLFGRDVTNQNGTLCGVYVVKTANAAQKVVLK